MPGYIVHLAAAKMWLSQRAERYDREWTEKFLIGNLLPDAVEDKNETHFRDPATEGKRVRYPELSEFLRATKERAQTPFWWGFYYHLYIDACFFKEYMPKLVIFLDKDGEEEDRIDRIVRARVRKSGRLVTQQEYFSEAYYYGDFTKLNDVLAERFQIDFEWKCQRDLPPIWRERVERQRTQLQRFLEQSKEQKGELQVFETEDLIAFLREKAEEFDRRDGNARFFGSCGEQ